MAAKRGDWRSVDGMYHFTSEQAREARDLFARRFPEARLRIKSFSTLGYSVQTFVERASAQKESK